MDGDASVVPLVGDVDGGGEASLLVGAGGRSGSTDTAAGAGAAVCNERGRAGALLPISSISTTLPPLVPGWTGSTDEDEANNSSGASSSPPVTADDDSLSPPLIVIFDTNFSAALFV